MSALSLSCHGETLWLLPERALWWPAQRVLFIADLHLGKAASFRALGQPVPAGTTRGNLDRLAGLLRGHQPRLLVLLGDFLHAPEALTPSVQASLDAWRAEFSTLSVTLVRGNHDRRAGDPPVELAIDCCDPPCAEGPFVLSHHPRPSPDGYVLAGHLHPSVSLRGAGRQRERLPCFHFGARVGLLPAFGGFTGTADVSVAPGDRVYVVADGQVVEAVVR